MRRFAPYKGLPPQAPTEYQDQATLWNAVEKAERGKKALLAYSFDIALQNELSLEKGLLALEDFEGASLGDIKKELEADGLPTSEGVKGWSYQVIQNILTNEKYIGGCPAAPNLRHRSHQQKGGNIYAHVMEEADQRNADILADVFLKKA